MGGGVYDVHNCRAVPPAPVEHEAAAVPSVAAESSVADVDALEG
jgi:hypothetical protein